jgi:flagellar hook assembly protein FlgD
LDDINPLRQHSEVVAKQNAVLFQPTDAIRGVYDAVFQYYLKSKVDTVKLEILDANGSVVQKFVGTKAEEKPTAGDWWGGGESKPTTAAGLNSFTWNLRYPGATVFEGIIIWGARPQNGPKAPTGKYQVRFTTGSYTQTYLFNVKINPNLKGVTDADLKEAFDLAIKIRDKESAANEAVIRIRKIRAQAEERVKEAGDAAFATQVSDWLAKLTAIEEDLYQTKNRSGQDPLNFPIKLGNRLSAVRRSLETGDNKPTAGAYQVFDELSKELDGQLTKLETTISGTLPGLNAWLKERGLKEIAVGK